MNAIELLKKDHDKVEELFNKVQAGGTGSQNEKLFKQIFHELSIHAIIEEQLFYPGIARFKEFAPLLKDAFKEHAEVKRSLGEIANLDSSSSEWKQKMEKLFADIKHHVKDEEEKMFPKVQEVVGENLLKELGAQLKEAKTSNISDDLLSMPHTLPMDAQGHASA